MLPPDDQESQNLILTIHTNNGIQRQVFSAEDQVTAFDAWLKNINQGIYATLMPCDQETERMTDAEIKHEAQIELKALMSAAKRISHNLQGRDQSCQATLLKIVSLTKVAIDELETPAGADENEWF